MFKNWPRKHTNKDMKDIPTDVLEYYSKKLKNALTHLENDTAKDVNDFENVKEDLTLDMLTNNIDVLEALYGEGELLKIDENYYFRTKVGDVFRFGGFKPPEKREEVDMSEYFY